MTTLMMKKNSIRTKTKQKYEADAAEYQAEIEAYVYEHRPDDCEACRLIKASRVGRVKGQEIIDDFLDGRENTGERSK